jgi:superfamily II DNA helicase RecQ
MKQQQVPPELQKAIEEGKQKIAQLEQENQAMKMDTSVDQKKAQDQSQLAEQKAQADVTLARQKAEADYALAQQKLANDREIELLKVKNARDIEAMKNDGVEEEGEDGKKTVKSGTEVVMQGLSMLGQLIVQQGNAQAQQMQELARIMAAPNELVRDPMTGKAAGSRKVLQ